MLNQHDNLLSFGSSQESIIRIVTGTVAENLLKSVLDKVPSLEKEPTLPEHQEIE